MTTPKYSYPRRLLTRETQIKLKDDETTSKSIALFLYLQFYPMLKKLNITRCSRSLEKNSKR